MLPAHMFTFNNLACPENTSSRLVSLCTPTAAPACWNRQNLEQSHFSLTTAWLLFLSLSLTHTLLISALFPLILLVSSISSDAVDVCVTHHISRFSRISRAWRQILKYVDTHTIYKCLLQWCGIILQDKLYKHIVLLHHIVLLSIIVHVEESACVKQEIEGPEMVAKLVSIPWWVWWR